MLDPSTTAQSRQALQIKDWATTCSDLLDGNKRALAQWFQGTQALFNEAASLAQARMLFTVESCSALLACRSPEQVIEQQRRFMMNAMERYAEELTSLSQLALRAASGGAPK
jgi:hypothetical protein